MKLTTLLGLLLVVSTVYSVPLDSEGPDEPTVVPDPMEEWPMDTGEDPAEEILEEMWDRNITIDDWDLDENGATEPSAYFTEEVKKYFEEQKLKSSDRETRQISGAIYHGNTIALQTFDRWHWLSCAGSLCDRRTCPRMQMVGSDWTNCWGEVFRIYRAAGPGIVRVGDLVGLYYPRESGHWLGCPGSECAKKSCPGSPSIAYGFQDENRWYQCWGEVFRIYSPGKGLGAVIDSGDDISLFYLQQSLWVAQGYSGNTRKTACLGTILPPGYFTYDACSHETFHIWKREY